MINSQINIYNTPFSRYGAYIGVTAEEKGIVLHNSRLRFDEGAYMAVTVTYHGKKIPYKIEANAWEGRILAEKGRVRFYIRDDHTIVFQSKGIDLEFEQINGYGYGISCGEKDFRLISSSLRTYALFHVEQGKGEIDGPIIERYEGKKLNFRQNFKVECQEEEILMALCFDNTEPREIILPIELEKEEEIIKKEWEAFIGKAVDANCVSDKYAVETWYNLWSSFVRAGDVYKYDALLMSKKFMSSLWSWDHCFNALALAQIDGQMALEQFLIPFAHQDKNGALPDLLNPNTEVLFTFTKPPVHGWCFSLLMDKYSYGEEVLQKVYTYLEKWTDWWLIFRDPDQDGIPDYPHGNDCGWDNSTVFDEGYYIESPDLPAFLILQMGCLARIAENLKMEEKVQKWKVQAEELKKSWYKHSWNGSRFVAKQSVTHQYKENPTSLLSVMPIVMGNELEKDKMEKLVKILEDKFLTEYGPATEELDSKDYESDGYWRGPIWAPSTYLLVDGLRRGGYQELAERIANGFCHMVKDIAHGNYENFDAVTGIGLRAPGYTWTASVYLLLEKEFRK